MNRFYLSAACRLFFLSQKLAEQTGCRRVQSFMKPPSLDQLITSQHIYIYMHTHICCEAIVWAKCGQFECYYLGQVCFFLTNTDCHKAHKKSGFSTFFEKTLRAQILNVIIWAKLAIYVAPNLAQIITFKIACFALGKCAEMPIFTVSVEHQPNFA